MKTFFITRSKMTEYAKATGLEMIRCKQSCNHVPGSRPAILLIDKKERIYERLVRCKVCAIEAERKSTQELITELGM